MFTFFFDLSCYYTTLDKDLTSFEDIVSFFKYLSEHAHEEILLLTLINSRLNR